MRRLLVVAIVLMGGAFACERTPVSPSSIFGPPALAVLAEAPVSDAIVNVTAGSVATDNHPGQSVTLPSGLYDNLHFNWYTAHKQPVAFGTLYLLTREYLGKPIDLPIADGVVAKSTSIVDGEYVFPAGFSVVGGRKYWFVGDTMAQYSTSFDTDIYDGGDAYNTGYFATPFWKSHASGRVTSFDPLVFVFAPPDLYVDANFRLRGHAISQEFLERQR